MVEVDWTLQSVNDIENIAEFIAKDSERYAEIQVTRFFEVTETLQSNPEIGRLVPELNNQSVREVILGNYRIIYTIVSKDLILILTVHHSKRSLFNNPALKNKEGNT